MDNSPQFPLPQTQVSPEKSLHLGHLLWEVVETVLLAAVLFLGVNMLSARIRVEGSSMEPTFKHGQLVLVNRLAYQWSPVSRGDVVILYLPKQPERDYIKRVIGLPGDRIEIRDRQVRVNGVVIDEPYIAAAPTYTGSWTVPEGSVFVLGDNRNNSTDSHNWGAVPMKDILGRAILIYWPPTQWELIKPIALGIE